MTENDIPNQGEPIYKTSFEQTGLGVYTFKTILVGYEPVKLPWLTNKK